MWEVGRIYAFAFGYGVDDRRCGELRVFCGCGRSSRNFRNHEFPRTLSIRSFDRPSTANVDPIRICLDYQLPQRLLKRLLGRDGRAEVRTDPVFLVLTHSNDPVTIAIVSVGVDEERLTVRPRNRQRRRSLAGVMASTLSSRRDVFRRIARRRTLEWPAYDSTPFYDRESLGGFEQDVRTVAGVWFEHDTHRSVDEFVCHLPLSYVGFTPHDRYTGPTRYGMGQLLRAFLVKELHGWDHETALVEYLQRQPSLRRDLGFETVPDQSTLWRSWHQRFTADLRETVEKAARPHPDQS